MPAGHQSFKMLVIARCLVNVAPKVNWERSAVEEETFDILGARFMKVEG
jgi:hypothetical protein